MNFHERLRELRTMSGFTQDYCAEQLGIKVITWRQYERGIRAPKIDALVRIAILFDVSLDDLLCVDDFKKSLSISSD